MAYLTETDFHLLIQEANLQQLIGADLAVLAAINQAAQTEVSGRLSQKFDVAAEFTDTTPWNPTLSYGAAARVYDATLPTALLYFAAAPAPTFNALLFYAIGSPVFWKGSTYTAVLATVPAYASNIQYGTYGNVPALNIYPDDPLLGFQYWGAPSSYQVPAGTALNNNQYWTPGDNRNQLVVLRTIDISLYHLSARITPKNVPEVRAIRYAEAIEWLKQAGDGDVETGLARLQPTRGARTRFGGNIKHINTY